MLPVFCHANLRQSNIRESFSFLLSRSAGARRPHIKKLLGALLLAVLLSGGGPAYAAEPFGIRSINTTIDKKIILHPVGADEPSRRSCGITEQRAKGFRPAYVDFVYDGDSLRLKNGLEVRLIGINTPEKGEEFAEEARAELLRQIGSGVVYLQPGEEWEDAHRRFLVHLWEQRGPAWVNLQEQLLREGMGHHVAIAPNFTNLECYQRAEAYARANRLGLWANFTATPSDAELETGFALVQGEVLRVTHKKDAGTELLLDGRRLQLWIPQSAYPLFGEDRDALRELRGKEVTATGWIYERREARRLQMSISHPSMLKYD